MDYNIKFEYKGVGKNVSGMRQKALKSQKGMPKKTGISESGGNQTISSIKSLADNISKLIKSNNDVVGALKTGTKDFTKLKDKKIPSKTFEPVKDIQKRRVGFTNGKERQTISSLKRLTSSITKLIKSNKNVIGAFKSGAKTIAKAVTSGARGVKRMTGAGGAGGLIAVGFIIQKIKQISDAYLDKVSQQLQNVGIAGFRRARGIYTSAQVGAGMRAYGMETGKFIGKKTRPPESALRVGAIFGLSAEETLKTAGQFRRAGAGYQQAVYAGAGMGIQAEVPTLLTGMAGIFTDAVREGINTSDMSKDMAQEISAIAIQTPAKSVDAALNIVKSFQGVQKQIVGGKMGTAQALFTTRASQQMLMEKLTGERGPSYLKKLEDQGFVSPEQIKRLRKLGPEAGFEDLLQAAPSAAFPLLRKFTAETSPVALQKRTMRLVKKSFGDTAEGKQRFYDFATSQGWAESQSQLETLMRAGEAPQLPVKAEKRGKEIITRKAKDVERSAAGLAVKRIQQREALILKYGNSFAKSSLKMEEAMLNIADEAAPLMVGAIKGMGMAVQELTGFLDAIIKRVKQSRNEKGEFDVKKFIGLPSFDLF